MKRSLAGIFLIALLLFSVMSSLHDGDFSLGRHPLRNLKKTAIEMSHPSFFDVWWGNMQFEYRSDDGTLLRTENRREVETRFLEATLRATWVTVKIASLGTFLAFLLAVPCGILTAKNLAWPKPLSMGAKLILDASRSIHSLIFWLFWVGIIGLGPTAGILAIALHSMGTFGKLFAKSIETLDPNAITAVKSVGATNAQIFSYAVWPPLMPQITSTYLYLWEYNIRDSTILGLVGAGGLGLLVLEAISLFQWGRLSTLVLVIIAMVSGFDSMSRSLRARLA